MTQRLVTVSWAALVLVKVQVTSAPDASLSAPGDWPLSQTALTWLHPVGSASVRLMLLPEATPPENCSPLASEAKSAPTPLVVTVKSNVVPSAGVAIFLTVSWRPRGRARSRTRSEFGCCDG